MQSYNNLNTEKKKKQCSSSRSVDNAPFLQEDLDPSPFKIMHPV